MKYEWYIIGVLACMSLLVLGILVFYSFFPTGTVDQSMLEANRSRRDITSGVNLLCCNAFLNREGNVVQCGTFVYDSNDPSGLHIQGLFYLGSPITAGINGTTYTGYLKKEDRMLRGPGGQIYMSVVLSCSIDQRHNTPGAGYVISKFRLNSIRATRQVYSGSTHLVPYIPTISQHDRIVTDKLPVHIRSFVANCFIDRLP